MANDAMIIAVDRIRFTFERSKKMRVYAVGITADNRGKVLVTEPPGSASIRHRPKADRPAIWDFGGDGYPIYQRTGGLADIIVAHLLVVRDRRATRRAGEIVREVSDSGAAKQAVRDASRALGSVGGGGLAAASALGLLLPVANLVGSLIADKKDRVLQTVSGSLFLTEERKTQDQFAETIKSPDGNLEVDADVFLFDAGADEDSVADTRTAETRLRADGLLFTDDDL